MVWPPWESVPNITKWYKSFFKQATKDTFAFWWAQMSIGMLIALIDLAQTLHQWPPAKPAAIHSVARGVEVYFALLAATFVFNAIRAPVKLASRREKRTKLLRKSAKTRISEKDAQIGTLQQENVTLRAKPTRGAAEQHHYDLAKAQLSTLSEEAKVLLRHIWSNEKVVAGPGLHVPGLDSRSHNYLFQQLKSTEMVRRQEEPGHGSYTIWWEIVPGYKGVLEEILYSRGSSATVQT